MRYRAKIITPSLGCEIVEVDAGNAVDAARFASTKGQLISLDAIRRSADAGVRATRFNLSVFNQQLFSLLEAGQPIVDAIDILGSHEHHSRQHSIYDALLQCLREGKQLSDAMAQMPSVFPAVYVAMVRSSETTGTVRDAVRRFSAYQRQADEVRKKVIAAAIYPAVLLAVAFLVVSFLMLYVVPRFSAVFGDVSARQREAAGLIQVWGGFVNRHGPLAWSLVISPIVALMFVAANRRCREVAGRTILALPWVGKKMRVMQISRLYRTLGILMRSGIAMPAAMHMTLGALPFAMLAPMERAVLRVSEGHTLSKVMTECGLSSPVADRLMVAGESSGNLDDMLERIADFYDQEMTTWIDTAGRLVEPLLMVGIGVLIGGVVLMLYMPIFELTNAI